jgi:hypothetical protein
MNTQEIKIGNARIVTSYNRIITVQIDGKTYLTEWHDYSVTTSKHRNSALNMTSKEVAKALKEKNIIKINTDSISIIIDNT